jgi:ElaB/YqjD/DUF883 family membrane-anchored ribosome-binding protein
MNPIPADTPKGKLFQEFHTGVADTEKLIKTAASAGNEQADALEASLGTEFSAATERLVRIRDDAIAHATAMAKTTDAYVQVNPWRSVGIVAVAAMVAGLVAGLSIARRPLER